MIPSPSSNPTIVLRGLQGETRFGARVVIDPGSGAMRPDHTEAVGEVAALPLAVVREVSGRWLIDAAADGQVSINGVPVSGGRMLQQGDVIGVGASQLLVEEAASASLALRRFELAGNDTFPPVDVPVRTLALVEDDVAIELGDVPVIDGAAPARQRARRALSKLKVASWIVGLLIAGAIGFFAMLVPVQVDLRPADAEVSNRGSFSWQAASTVFMFPGKHRLRAVREGYLPGEVDLVVKRDADNRTLMHLNKLPGLITVDTGGVAAEVMVDGAPVGKVPGEVSVPAGDRTLTIRAPRHLDHLERLAVTGGGAKQNVSVKLAPSFGVVAISSVPSGAAIEVDGQAQGVTPATLELDAGVRRVQITAPGLALWTSSVAVKAGEKSSLGPITLGAADARLLVRSVPSGSQVTTGGSFRGVTPVTIALSPGASHVITVTRAGYEPYSREVFAEANKDSTLDARLAALLVSVRVQGEPADAQVFVNGEARGNVPATLSLPASRQRIEVRKEGYDPFITDLVLAPGIARTVDFKLINPRDIAANAAPKYNTKSGIRMLLIPGGTYSAGSDRREQGRRPNEGAHKVTLVRPFYLGEREVTNEQYRRFDQHHNAGSAGKFSLDLDKQAAARISWNQAAAYCNWLSTEEGLTPAYAKVGEDYAIILPVGNGYRLPTEGEWEYAARVAGNKTLRYPWGAELPVQSGVANFGGAEAVELLGNVLAGHRDEFPGVAAPALFAPNALGFYDMAGNVSEWTNDRYLSFVASAAVTDPLGPAEGKNHTVRGSNWRTVATNELRFAFREGMTGASDVVGFRIARYVEK
jgi:formylglycine-generating enzyme required for sulfatase activity